MIFPTNNANLAGEHVRFTRMPYLNANALDDAAQEIARRFRVLYRRFGERCVTDGDRRIRIGDGLKQGW